MEHHLLQLLNLHRLPSINEPSQNNGDTLVGTRLIAPTSPVALADAQGGRDQARPYRYALFSIVTAIYLETTS